MSIKLTEKNNGNVLEVDASGKLHKEDYDHLVPEFERRLKTHGKLRLLFHMKDFHGWDAAALWEDIKFDVRHFTDIERVAMVGDKTWEKGMTMFCRPFTTAAIRYFDESAMHEAEDWVSAA